MYCCSFSQCEFSSVWACSLETHLRQNNFKFQNTSNLLIYIQECSESLKCISSSSLKTPTNSMSSKFIISKSGQWILGPNVSPLFQGIQPECFVLSSCNRHAWEECSHSWARQKWCTSLADLYCQEMTTTKRSIMR